MIRWTQASDWSSIIASGMPVAYTDSDHHDAAAAQSILIKTHFKWILSHVIGIVDILEALKVIEDNKLYCLKCFQSIRTM